jgi:hypothetical protein
MRWAKDMVCGNAITRARQAGISGIGRILAWASTAEILFRDRFTHELGPVRYRYQDVEKRAETEGMTLAEQVRFWEQDESRRIVQEQGDTNHLG